LLKVLDSIKLLLLKGWVYTLEEVITKVKTKVVDPDRYLTLGAPLMRSKCKAPDLSDDPLPQSQQALNTIEALPSSPSVSVTKTAAKRQHVTSTPTLTLLTPL
jgi:hypothetical protein